MNTVYARQFRASIVAELSKTQIYSIENESKDDRNRTLNLY